MRAASSFEYFRPLGNIYHEAAAASKIISLNARFGEGWLLPGEIATFAASGVNNVVSLQPFGCIANHIVAKGVEKRIKTLYPQMNLLSLDFDGSVSDVNITTRLLLFHRQSEERMAAMRSEPADCIEARIVEAARALFIEKGYADASMSDIAAAAGINRSTLHYYFRTKDRLFQAIFADIVREIFPRITGHFWRRRPPLWERLNAVIDEYMALVSGKSGSAAVHHRGRYSVMYTI